MHNARVDTAEELLSGFDALLDRCIWVMLGRVAVHLSGIEHGIAACEQQTRTAYRVLFAIVLCFG